MYKTFNHFMFIKWIEPKSISIYCHGQPHHTYNFTSEDPFHQDFFILLNVAMGGNYVGNTIDPTLNLQQWKLTMSAYINNPFSFRKI